MITHRFPYGTTEIELHFPDSARVRVLENPMPPAIEDIEEALEHGLQHPIASEPFDSLFQPDDLVSIIIPDLTRKAGLRQVLPPLLMRLHRIGVPRDNLTLVVALGTHRPMRNAELSDMLGTNIAEKYTIFQHDSEAKDEIVELGQTSHRTPIALNRRVLPPYKVLIVGSITHHYFAGFGGGAKMIAPGVASTASTKATHRLTLKADAPGYFHPNCQPGQIESNPVRDQIEEIVAQVNPTFLINTVLSLSGEIIGMFAGHWQAAFRAGAAFTAEHFQIPLAERAPCVIAAGSGFPKDVNLIQSHKGLEYASYALQPGGDLLYLAACDDGVGSQTFLPWFAHDDLSSMFTALQANYTINGHTALAMRRKTRDFRVHFHSTLDNDIITAIGAKPVSDPQRWVDGYVAKNPESDILLLPRGGHFVPKSTPFVSVQPATETHRNTRKMTE